MDRRELLDALVAEQYNGGGWATRHEPSRPLASQHLALDEIAGRRRMRELLAEVDASEHADHWRSA